MIRELSIHLTVDGLFMVMEIRKIQLFTIHRLRQLREVEKLPEIIKLNFLSVVEMVVFVSVILMVRIIAHHEVDCFLFYILPSFIWRENILNCIFP